MYFENKSDYLVNAEVELFLKFEDWVIIENLFRTHGYENVMKDINLLTEIGIVPNVDVVSLLKGDPGDFNEEDVKDLRDSIF